MTEMAYVLDGRLLIVANTKAPVPASEWEACVRDLYAHAQKHWLNEDARILVFTEGGSPDAVQRKLVLDKVPQIKAAKGAVLTSNTLVRGVATAFSWFTSGFRVFQPSDLDKALAWLELRDDERSIVALGMKRVRNELGDRARSVSRAM